MNKKNTITVNIFDKALKDQIPQEHLNPPSPYFEKPVEDAIASVEAEEYTGFGGARRALIDGTWYNV